MRDAVVVLVVVLCVLGPSGAAVASWMYVPPIVLLDEAEAVVVGKMTKVDAAAGTGIIAVSEVLKGDSELKEAKTAFSRRTGLMHSAMITFNDGDEGVWILSRKDANGAYPLDYPLLHQEKAKVAEVKGLLAALAKREWSQPVNGLSASVCFDSRPGVPDQGAVVLALRNSSDKPLRVCTYIGSKLVEVAVTDPEGNVTKPDLYGFLAAARLRAMGASDFVELAPGDVRHPVWREGISVGPWTKKGVYKIQVTYASDNDGKNFNLGNVWTGQLTVPEIQVTR